MALLLLALALAMDSLAVAIVRGASGPHRLSCAIETGLIFGLAQGIMPLLGWAVGDVLLDRIADWDHWIAFGLLGFLGLRMLGNADGEQDSAASAAPMAASQHYTTLALAAIATSIDAAAAGLTLNLFDWPVAAACLVIGLVTTALCIPAYWFATVFGTKFGRRAEILGGVVLIMLGIRIVLEHTGWL